MGHSPRLLVLEINSDVHGACLLILMAVQKPQRKTIKRYIRDCSLAQEVQEEELRHVSTAIDA